MEALNRIAAHRARVRFDDPADVDMHVRTCTRDEFGVSRLRLSGVSYAATTDPIDFVLAGLIANGQATINCRRRRVVLLPGDGWVSPIGVPYTSEFGNTTFGVVSLPFSCTADLAETLTGLPAVDFRFESTQPVSESMRRYWAHVISFLCRLFTAPDPDLPPPLVTEQLLRLAGSALLVAFPNTTMTTSYRPGPGWVPPAVVRRATAFIETHADQRLTVRDIAAAADIGLRGLQEAFRRHLGTTPMEYLCRVRLERAHRELLCATPGSGVTVKQVARRWGFANPGRFASKYRIAYGQAPSRSLRI